MLVQAIAHGVGGGGGEWGGGTDTVSESLHWKLALGEKSLAAPGNRTCANGVPVRRSNQLSYIPILNL